MLAARALCGVRMPGTTTRAYGFTSSQSGSWRAVALVQNERASPTPSRAVVGRTMPLRSLLACWCWSQCCQSSILVMSALCFLSEPPLVAVARNGSSSPVKVVTPSGRVLEFLHGCRGCGAGDSDTQMHRERSLPVPLRASPRLTFRILYPGPDTIKVFLEDAVVVGDFVGDVGLVVDEVDTLGVSNVPRGGGGIFPLPKCRARVDSFARSPRTPPCPARSRSGTIHPRPAQKSRNPESRDKLVERQAPFSRTR